MRRYGLTLLWASSVLLPLLAFVSTPALAATILINDGQSSVVTSYGGSQESPNQFVVHDLGCGVPDPLAQPCATAGTPTLVEFGPIADGAVSEVRVLDSSSIIADGVSFLYLYGRAYGGISATGRSHVDVRNGGGGYLDVGDQASATITGLFGGGRFTSQVGFSGDSQGSINGTIEGVLQVGGNSRVSLVGTAYNASVIGSGYLEITGGFVAFLGSTGGSIDLRSGGIAQLSLTNTAMRVTGGYLPSPTGLPLVLFGSSLLSLDGASFKLDGVPVGFGPVSAESGSLEVTYASGESYATTFRREPTTSLILTPEPSTALLMLLGLAGLSWRQRPDAVKEAE